MNAAVPTCRSREPKKGCIDRFYLNHPKNYLAVPISIAAPGDSRELISQYAVSVVDRAISGAEMLDLVTTDMEVSSFGEAVNTAACRLGNGYIDVLESFKDLHRSSKRFVDVMEDWSGIARKLAFNHSATKKVVEVLRSYGDLPLDRLTGLVSSSNPDLVENVFLRMGAGSVQDFRDASVYNGKAVFQFKAFLYHCGVLESRGCYRKELVPSECWWRLEKKL